MELDELAAILEGDPSPAAAGSTSSGARWPELPEPEVESDDLGGSSAQAGENRPASQEEPAIARGVDPIAPGLLEQEAPADLELGATEQQLFGEASRRRDPARRLVGLEVLVFEPYETTA